METHGKVTDVIRIVEAVLDFEVLPMLLVVDEE